MAQGRQTISPRRRQDGPSRPAGKISRHGVTLSAQPRIRLLRSLDQRSHSYLGYLLHLQGIIADEARKFMVVIGDGAQDDHRFLAGGEVSGEGVFVTDPPHGDGRTVQGEQASGTATGSRPTACTPPGTVSHQSFRCIASAAIAGSTPGPTTGSAQPACGVERSQWTWSSITGTQARRGIARRPSAKGRSRARSIGPGPPARCPAEAA